MLAADEGLEFTEASEFARSIQLREPEDGAKPSDDDHMGVQGGTATAAATPQPSAAPAPKQRKPSSKYVADVLCHVFNLEAPAFEQLVSQDV